MIEEEASGEPLYRVDKFVVPEHGRDEFLGRVATTHALLRSQDGFVRDFASSSNPGQASSTS
jgi:hypothetical protein